MQLVCRQSQILSHVQELGGSMQRDPRDVVLPFFNRVEEKEYVLPPLFLCFYLPLSPAMYISCEPLPFPPSHTD